MTDVIKTFGSNYTVIDASTADPKLAGLELKAYHFDNQGVTVTFFKNQLIFIQTSDIPVLTNNSSSFFTPESSNHPLNPIGLMADGTSKIDPLQAVVWAIWVGARLIVGDDDVANRKLSNLVGTCLFDSSDCGSAIKRFVKAIGTEKDHRTGKTWFSYSDGIRRNH